MKQEQLQLTGGGDQSPKIEEETQESMLQDIFIMEAAGKWNQILENFTITQKK